MKKLKLIFWVIGILLVGGWNYLAAFFAFTHGVLRRLRQSSDKWQKVAKKLTFGAVLLNNLTKNHAACRKQQRKKKKS